MSYKVQKESEKTKERLIERLKIMYSIAIASSAEPIRNPFAYLKRTVINISPDQLPSLATDKKFDDDEDNFDIDMYKIFINRCIK